MLILDRASENKLEELVLVSRKLNGVLREIYPRVHKIEPDRAALLWCAIDDEIEKRQKQIDKILATESGAEQIVLRRACRELKKEYDQYNQLMEEAYNEELLPATIPELLISSVKNCTGVAGASAVRHFGRKRRGVMGTYQIRVFSPKA